MDNFDFIIVGAGSAGCVLADKLSASGRHRVLVLEAGGSDRHFWLRVPVGYARSFRDPAVNWQYTAEAEAALEGRALFWPRGKVVGGSSSINALVYCRGLPHDFDDWRAMGGSGWGWSDIKPIYESFERRIDPDGSAHGEGALAVSDVTPMTHPLRQVYFAAAAEMGLPYSEDFNGDRPEGVGLYRITTRNGLRCSAADAFLHPALKRQNLTMLTNAFVRRIVVENGRATGVEIERGGSRETLRAANAVILSAGAVNSPQILQLSGIGPGALLQGLGVKVLRDSPAVGDNLQDHIAVSYFYKANRPTLNDELNTWMRRMRAGARYLLTRKGPLSLSVNQCGGFVRGDNADRPNLQLYFNPLSFSTAKDEKSRVYPDPFPGFILSFQPSRPESRGRIDAHSPDPHAAPAIRPNYLATDGDIADVMAGGRLIRRMAETRAFRALIAERTPPDVVAMNDAEVVADFRKRGSTVFHPTSTCRLGDDPYTSVVDARLRVHGVEGLRVVDASVFPTVTSGNTNAPAIMVGHKGAAMILEDAR